MLNYSLSWSSYSECHLVSEFDRPEVLWVWPTAAAREYDPTAEPGLIPAFGRINLAWRLRVGRVSSRVDRRDPVAQAVLAFVRDWGHLGQTQLGHAHPAVEVDGMRKVATHADQLGWVVLHARSVDLVMTLLHALSSGNDRVLRRVLTDLRAAGTKSGGSTLARRRTPTTSPPWNVALELPPASERVRQAARDVLAQILDPNLEGVRRETKHGRGPVFTFKALVQLIYWRIADGFETKTPVRQCMCGAQFFVDHDSQRFCPAPPGVGESRCGRRYRMRAQRRSWGSRP
jgi:hypothetical protein